MIERNASRVPRVIFYDLALVKHLALKEWYNLSFEANFFNVFNRANFGVPINTLTKLCFGQITSTVVGTNPRQS
jgi:hypothetical protein